MRKKESSDVMTSLVAVLADAAAVCGGFMWATWIKFYSGLLPLSRGTPPNVLTMYAVGAAFATLLFLVVFRFLGLYVRPQVGSFTNKIPRLIKGTGLGVVLTPVLAFTFKNSTTIEIPGILSFTFKSANIEYSTHVVAVSFATVAFLVLLERYILYRIEWNLARHSRVFNRVLILGTDAVAAHLKRALHREPMLRSKIVGFVSTDDSEPDPEIAADQIKGGLTNLESVAKEESADQIILTATDLGSRRIMDIVLLCDRNLIMFNMVPDLFRLMTSSMDFQSLDDIPLLGLKRWPLELFWNRVLKRAEDIVGAVLGSIVAAPVVAAAAVAIKRTSPGPVFFRQERCGEGGRIFRICKLRTMTVDAEKETGPVFAASDDPRRTRVGGFLRRHNLDELPQFWNVLKGEMSLVGPRPERPHFVEQFKTEIGRYMWRHVMRPGLTGWAQVNGLRGDTSIEERIKYDLYYLENWSLAFDFKIILKTFFARENAY